MEHLGSFKSRLFDIDNQTLFLVFRQDVLLSFELPGFSLNELLLLLCSLSSYESLTPQCEIPGSCELEALDGLLVVLLFEESEALELPAVGIKFSLA